MCVAGCSVTRRASLDPVSPWSVIVVLIASATLVSSSLGIWGILAAREVLELVARAL